MTDDVAPLLDAETKVGEADADDKAELRLWLRLLTCVTMAEAEIRRRLRECFDVTLPRFDLLAQLERADDGMTLGEVSRRMMVSNGNVTGLVERLAASGHIERFAAPGDRRARMIRLTPAGRAEFRTMAATHEDWIAHFFAGLSAAEIERLMGLLGRTKASLRSAIDGRG